MADILRLFPFVAGKFITENEYDELTQYHVFFPPIIHHSLQPNRPNYQILTYSDEDGSIYHLLKLNK